MLNDIVIHGYRGLDGLKLKGAGKYNLIVGLNNAGKTSLLEALFLHCAPLNLNIALSAMSFRYGGLKADMQYIYDQLKWFFAKIPGRPDLDSKRADEWDSFTIEGKWNRAKRKTTFEMLDGAMVPHRTLPSHRPTTTTMPPGMHPDDVEQAPDIEGISLGQVLMSIESATLGKTEQKFNFVVGRPLEIPPPKIRTDIKAVYSDAFMHRTLGVGLEEHSKAVEHGLETRCLKLIQNLDPEIESVSILQGPGKSYQLFTKHKTLGSSPMGNLGDGIRRMYLAATFMTQAEGGVFLIDDLESAIHSTGLSQFIGWVVDAAKDLNIQVFATTHSIECIDAVLGSNIGKDSALSLFKLKRENGQASCQRITGANLKKLRHELGQDVRW